MKPIQYEFEIYDDIIHGDLKPGKLSSAHLRIIVNFLKEEYDECHSILLAEFHKNSNRYQLVNENYILNAHPMAKQILNQKTIRFGSDENFNLPNYILNQINEDISSAVETFELKNKNKRIVGFLEETNWTNINIDRLKYCYFYRLLKSNNREIKKRMRKTLFSLEEDALKQFVVRAQRILLGFTNYISNKYQLKIDEIDYKIKNHYDDRDCMILVYSSLIELINCLEKEQRKYLDITAKIPINNDLKNRYEMSRKHQEIEETIIKLEIKESFKHKITNPLQKFKELTLSSSITYLELQFFNQLYNKLKSTTSEYKKTFNEDYLIRVFFEVNFNHLAIMELIVDTIKESLKVVKSPDKKKIILLERQKCISQIINTDNVKFQNNTPSLKTTVLNWIERELDFLDNTRTPDELNYNKRPIQNKLYTDLKVPEIALLFKLLNDSNVIEPKSLNQLNNWISQTLVNEHTTTISTNKLKNSMYDYSEKSIEKVKSKLIEMINQLNQL